MFSGLRTEVTSRPSVGSVHSAQMARTDRRSGRLRTNGGRQAATRATRALSIGWADAVMLPSAVV
jgi:hypothetical protein